MKKYFFGLIVAAAASSAMAQVSVGSVNGLVTATVDNQLVNVRQGSELPEGVQLNVPAGASVNVSVKGCMATVTGPASVLMSESACRGLLAGQGATGGGAAVGGVNRNWVYAGGAAGALWAIRENRKKPVVVPNPSPSPSRS